MTPTRVVSLCAALWLLAFSGCDTRSAWSPDTRFACQADGDCAAGFVCDPAIGECVPEGSLGDAGQGGGVGGGAGGGSGGGSGGGGGDVDAGEVDAGDADAGDLDAGTEDAGEDAGLPEDAGSADAGSADAGIRDAGPPMAIAITSATQSLYLGTCSAPFTVQLRDGLGAPTVASSVTPISVSTAAGIVFSPAADCSDAGQSVFDVPAGASSVSLYYRGLDAGTYTLRAAAAGLGQDTQDTNIRLLPDSLAITTTPPTPLPAGTCFGLTVQARRGGTATLVAGSTPVSFTVSPAGAARFHSSSSCSGTPVTSTAIPSGSNSATIYVKTLSGGAVTLTANASFGSATQNLTVLPSVRTGQCSFSSSMNSQPQTITCGISPALGDVNRSFLLFGTTTTATDTTALNVRCRLLNSTSVECMRRTGSGAATVAWQVAESPTGLRVEHLAPTACGVGSVTVSLATPVNPARSFVLKSASNAGNNFDDDDMPMAVLAGDGGAVTYSPGDCETIQSQVVELTGVAVARGASDGGMAVGVQQLDTAVTSTPTATTAVLAQPGSLFQGAAAACAQLARAEVFSTTRLRFTRGAGTPADAGCDGVPLSSLFYERVDFGTRGAVQQQTVTLAPGTLTATATISPVDRTRAIVFSGSQAFSGQGSAETDLLTSGAAVPAGEALVRFAFDNDTTVRVTREGATATARVTFFVVELVP